MEEHCKAFREKLYRAGAFIPEAQFIEFETLLNLCGDVQATFYNEMYMYSDKEKEVAIKKIENNIEKLHESQKNLMATMREYLTKYMPTAQDSGKKNDSKQS